MLTSVADFACGALKEGMTQEKLAAAFGLTFQQVQNTKRA